MDLLGMCKTVINEALNKVFNFTINTFGFWLFIHRRIYTVEYK